MCQRRRVARRFGTSQCESRRADSNRLPLLQIRVIHQALQGFAEGRKCRIYERLSLVCLALRCTVLRSRWYQSGIIIPIGSASQRTRRRSARYSCRWRSGSLWERSSSQRPCVSGARGRSLRPETGSITVWPLVLTLTESPGTLASCGRRAIF